jgi:hypothetical protein
MLKLGGSMDPHACFLLERGIPRFVQCIVQRRVLRYCARPPFALERLHAPAGIASLASSDARLVYRLPKPAPDGRTELQLSLLELGDFLLDQTSGFDPAEAEPVPDFVFDQSLPEEFEA